MGCIALRGLGVGLAPGMGGTDLGASPKSPVMAESARDYSLFESVQLLLMLMIK